MMMMMIHEMEEEACIFVFSQILCSLRTFKNHINNEQSSGHAFAVYIIISNNRQMPQTSYYCI
jgi:hypothetical protein